MTDFGTAGTEPLIAAAIRRGLEAIAIQIAVASNRKVFNQEEAAAYLGYTGRDAAGYLRSIRDRGLVSSHRRGRNCVWKREELDLFLDRLKSLEEIRHEGRDSRTRRKARVGVEDE